MSQKRLEDQLQHTMFEHLAVRARPKVVGFAIPNGGYRSKAEAAIMKGLGVVPGIPDTLLIRDGRPHFLELKTKDGKLTPVQIAVQDELRAAGAVVATAYGLDEALCQLEAWQILRGSRR